MNDLLRMVSEADKRTLPTVSQLSENDIKSIWADVSTYIDHQMNVQKGVHVAGLGTFTFSQQTLDVGQRLMLIQRPVFLLSRRLAESLGLKQVRPLAEGSFTSGDDMAFSKATQLAVVQLNFTAVSQETPFSRDVVEGCVRETLVLLSRALASEINVFLTLQGIGVLYFKNNKVRMKFNPDFIKAMDGTGRLLLAFNNRPGSSVSSLSAGPSRLQRPQTANPVTLPTARSPQPDNKAGDKDRRSSSPAADSRNAGEVLQQRGSKSHQSPQVKAVSVAEGRRPKPPVKATENLTTSIPQPEVAPKLEESRIHAGCSDHSRAGQELCYLCMQRAQRNAPVHRRQQQQAEEEAQERLLLLKAQQRDEQYMDREQAKLDEQRKHAKQVATFNLQMSERKSGSPLFPTSSIFPARPLTPVRRIQHHHHMNELQSRMEARRHHEARGQRNRRLAARLDQVQQVQEVAQQLQQKHESTKHHRKALDTQVDDKKCKDPPECQSYSSWFVCSETAANDAESRERAKKLLQVNFSAATQRKRTEMHKRQVQLEKEREVLKHYKMELILGCINRFERSRDVCKSLQEEWSRSATLKHQREEEERRFLRSAGQLLVDKLDEYKRCCQCKRRNNTWRDQRLERLSSPHLLPVHGLTIRETGLERPQPS